jgi:hypothetical protein
MLTSSMKLLIISSCTNAKSVEAPNSLKLSDFRSPDTLRAREAELNRWLRPAFEMYAGEQHKRLVHGVKELRAAFGRQVASVKIVSAGYGLIDEEQLIAPYNVTFATMSRSEQLAWSQHLGIARAVREAIRGWPLVFFLLGDAYLRAIEPPIKAEAGQRLIFVCKAGLSQKLIQPRTTIVSVGLNESQRFGAGYVALKGRMCEVFAHSLAREGESLFAHLCTDNTAVTFMKAVERGLDS